MRPPGVSTTQHTAVWLSVHRPGKVFGVWNSWDFCGGLYNFASVAGAHCGVVPAGGVGGAGGEDGVAGVVELRHGGPLRGVAVEQLHNGPPEGPQLAPVLRTHVLPR